MQGAQWTIVAIFGVFLIAFGISLPLAVSLLTGSDASEGIGLRGKVDMVLYDKSGMLKDERHLDNLIVGSGVEGVAYKIAPFSGSISSSAPYNFIALGTGSVAVDTSQTGLQAELPIGASYTRVQDSLADYNTASGNKLILSVTFLPGQGTGTLRESGIFDAGSGGNMLARQTFADIQKAAGDTLTVTWTITLSPS